MRKQLMYSALAALTLFLTACSGNDDSPVENTPSIADNILIIRADPNSFYAKYEMLFNDEIIHGSVGQVSSEQHKVVNAQLITHFEIKVRNATEASFHLNQSNITETQLDEGGCYELTFTTNAQGIAIIDELTKVDCN